MTNENFFFPLFSQAHVVAAFEQSLSNMTGRLQSLTATTEKKVTNLKAFFYFNFGN